MRQAINKSKKGKDKRHEIINNTDIENSKSFNKSLHHLKSVGISSGV
jgi:hypothetical protein